MSNFLESAKNGLGSLVRGALRLRDPHNVDSQVNRSDLAEPDSEPAVGTAKELVQLGDERFEEARIAKYRHNRDLLTGIALYQGKQWYEYDENSGSMQAISSPNTNPDFDERFIRRTEPIIGVLVDRAVARIVMDYPDAWAAPETESEKDKKAAQIARAINAHCTRNTDRRRLIREAVLDMLISTTTFYKVGWDAKAWATVGIPQPDGSIEYHRAQIGDVCGSVMLATDAYPDPNAYLTGKGIHGGAYFVERHIYTLSYIQEKWGKTVTATAPSDTYGYLEQRLEWIAGDQNRVQSKVKNATEVTEVWEKPSKRFPDGRYWAYSGDHTLLYAGKWPYDKKDKYPYVEFGYKKNQASVWALNMVMDLRDVQIQLNKLATYIAGRMEWDRPVLFNPDNSEIAPDDLISPHYAQVINYKGEQVGGAKPTWAYPPPPGDFYFKEHERLMAKAEYIAGVRDFNSDTASPLSSAKELELRMQEDKSRLGPHIERVCENVAEIDEWDIALYKQFGASFPRLLGLDDRATPAKDLQGANVAASALVDMQALKDGNCRVVWLPGSGISRLPASREEEIMDVCKAMVNMPAPIVEFMLTQLQSIRSDADVDRFLDAYKAYEQQQQQQKLMEIQAQGQNAQSLQQQKLQAQQASDALDAQAEQEKAAIGVHAASLEQTWRMQTDMAVEAQRHQNAMELQNAKQSTPTFSVSMPLKPGINATRSAEEAMGLTPDTPEQVKAANAPPAPKMASPAKPKGASNGKS